MTELPRVEWPEGGTTRTARWRSEAGVPPPTRLQVVDDTLKADAAYRLASEGTSLLWRSDYHNARQLLQAMGRRALRKRSGRSAPQSGLEPSISIASRKGNVRVLWDEC